jgi:hypothetical protein
MTLYLISKLFSDSLYGFQIHHGIRLCWRPLLRRLSDSSRRRTPLATTTLQARAGVAGWRRGRKEEQGSKVAQEAQGDSVRM